MQLQNQTNPVHLRLNYSFHNIKHIKRTKTFHMLITVFFLLSKFILQIVTTDSPFNLI